eukprot:3264513-Amphidinium_carterae.1
MMRPSASRSIPPMLSDAKALLPSSGKAGMLIAFSSSSLELTKLEKSARDELKYSRMPLPMHSPDASLKQKTSNGSSRRLR